MKKNLQRISKKTCSHEFIFENLRNFHSCLGTHHISKCLYCNCDYQDTIYEIIPKKVNNDINYYRTPLQHFHIWRSDGTCGSYLCFPDKKNGDNYGFDKKEKYNISNENRICKCKR
jgi:hypothetical protein